MAAPFNGLPGLMLTIPTSVISGELSRKLRAIADIGFEGVDLSLADAQAADTAGLIQAEGLQIASIIAKQDEIPQALHTARTIGAPLVVAEITAIPKSLPVLHATRLALCPTREVEDDIRALVSGASDPMLGLALSSYEALKDGSRPARLRDLDGAKVFHISLLDGPQQPLLPAQGILNLGGFARVLARSGYDGPWSTGIAAQDANNVLNAYRSLVAVLNDAAQTEPLLRKSTPQLPAKVPAKGIEFIEFSVDAAGAATLEANLSALAFRRERQHFTKQVTLWRQGSVNIVINQENTGHAGQMMADHGPCVCDMGLRVQNAAETQARASALGTPAFDQSIALGELNIPAIPGIGGSIVHFIDEQSDLHRVWDIEFAPVGRTKATQPAGLRRIDHVAQTMPFDEMQSWLLYYLSTFEMTKSPVVNVADPSGIVRSQAIETPEGEVRLNLNGASDEQTLAGSFMSGKTGAGVQHVAFQTDDIFETSARLTECGFARLQVPHQYYNETQAEFGLNDALTDALRQGHILYDRDEQGAYFQLYGEAIFDGFFFEIVQRQGRYAGYGARNAPVRLTSQAKARDQKGAV